MNLLFHFLGLVAAINEWMSRRTIYFMQLNWILIPFLFVVSVSSLVNLEQSFHVNKIPIEAKISELGDLYQKKQAYVTLNGYIFPNNSYPYGQTESDPDSTYYFVSFIDTEENKKILIKIGASEYKKGEPAKVQITGMLEEIPAEIEEVHKAEENSVPLATTICLYQNETPPDTTEYAILSSICLPLFLAFMYTFLQRYTVTIPNRERIRVSSTAFDQFGSFATETPVQTPTQTVDGFISGKLLLEPNNQKSFYDVPTTCNILDNGTILCASNIDASFRIFGFAIKPLEGIWTCDISKGKVSKVEPIFHFFGLKKRKGLLIHFRNTHLNKKIVLSFDSDKNFQEVYKKLA